jgi:hypothetical protein
MTEDKYLQPILDLQRALAAAFEVGLTYSEVINFVDDASENHAEEEQ